MTAVREQAPRTPPRFVVRIAWMLHRAAYRLTGGRFGLSRPEAGSKFGMLRLASVGRKSGQPRVAIIGYYEDGPNLVTLAMNGWGRSEPAWWLNLQAQPETTVGLADGPRAVRARAATGAERERLWERFAEFPGWGADIDALATLRPTDTTVVVFEPSAVADRDHPRGPMRPSETSSAIAPAFATLSVVTLTAAAVVVGIHHVYREGLVLLLPFAVLAALPYLLMRWFRASRSRAGLGAYAALSTVVIVGFSFVDGFLDHVLNAVLGLYATATGQEADHLDRAFRVLPPTHLVGDFFYEATGILEFVAGVVAAYYAYRLVRAAIANRANQAKRGAS